MSNYLWCPNDPRGQGIGEGEGSCIKIPYGDVLSPDSIAKEGVEGRIINAHSGRVGERRPTEDQDKQGVHRYS